MTDKIFSNSGLPIRRSVELLPNIFQTDTNDKFLSGTFDPLIQPGVLDKVVGYVGKRYGKTYNGSDIYLDPDNTLRSRYQLEPAVVINSNNNIKDFYDYIDFKNQIKFFGHNSDRDDKITAQDHYSWNPPIDWDKFINFREYYWIPDGPPTVTIEGQSQDIVSTYRVKLGEQSSFIFFPDGLKNNPTITLYRGQTYKFTVNTPGNGFVIRTNYDTGSLRYNPDFGYKAGQLAVFDQKIWRAKKDIPFAENVEIIEESELWEFVEPESQAASLDYNIGVKNNGATRGTVTFEVPLDAPDILFYQSSTVPDRLGKFIIDNVKSNTKINVEDEIIGKVTYISSNNVTLSNGMIIRFFGQIIPEKYSKDKWVVEGVGTEISLTRFEDLVPPNVSTDFGEILFDNAGFDTEPFDDASLYPASKDYILINRSSKDLNPWSRYNRWFHRSVLEFSHNFNGTDFDAKDTLRAKRPIIEFAANLQLFNHGSVAKKFVDFVDTFTDDIFSKIEGSRGYIVDGQELFQGARILFTADTDRLANNRIYQVNFIDHSTGSSYRADWSPKISYRSGETVRFNGQPFSASTDSRSFTANIVSTSSINNRIRILKNLNIVVDQAVIFEGQLFGGLEADQVYFVTEVFNSEVNATEFTISKSRRSFTQTLIIGAPGEFTMTGFFSAHPTDVNFWRPSVDRRQISLIKVSDTESILGETVLAKLGNKNKGKMFYFDGNSWQLAQDKISINQEPLFDAFDNDGVSFSDTDRYPVSSFAGTHILSYKRGSSVIDSELGFSLSYLNINNVGDISFSFDWDTDKFFYEISQVKLEKFISSGYLLDTSKSEYSNCWIRSDEQFEQAIIDSVIITEDTNIVEINAIKWKKISDSQIYKVLLYINGSLYQQDFTRENNKFIFSQLLKTDTVVTVKVFCNAIPDNGYYEIPTGLERNPLNQKIQTFTLGEATDHISTAVDLIDTFSGQFPGSNNLRDISGYQPLARRFLKHSGLAPIAISLLCDKKINIIKSLEFSVNSYREYKNKFLQLASTLDFNQDPVQLCDDVIVAMTKIKKENDAFSDSDMLGAGASRKISYVVEDDEIKVFALNEKFDLENPSRRAVYVYLNGSQLIVEKDYSFNSSFGFVELLVDLAEGDLIEIREYTSTAFSYMPPTPTKLGLYKRFLPEKYIDDTYLKSTEVIQGHDGSITVAYGDYRDDVLLELERRIYNNIKKIYSTEIFDIDRIISGRYYQGIYSKEEIDALIGRQFRKWLQQTNTNSALSDNNFFDQENPFTYVYSSLTDDDNNKLPGFWRGIYQFYYDTDRPHRCPWEMLGFSEQPEWWTSEYGPAPYTSNNLILWEDLRDGIIRQGGRTGRHNRYARPTILSHIPVDADGNLLDPLTSNLVGQFPITAPSGNFKFGDISPVENSWRKSSDYPFAIMIALSITNPFEFLIENLDKNLVVLNNVGQTVSRFSGEFVTLDDIQYPVVGETLTSGLINYVTDYVKSLGLLPSLIKEKLSNIDVNLSTRLSGFVDKTQQKYLLDSKNPSAKSSSIFVPQENYNIIFDVSIPIRTLTYSGIIIEKSLTGFKLFGYDTINPVFKYYSSYVSESLTLSVGGTSERFEEWGPGKTYTNGALIRYRSDFYRSIRSHVSSAEFDTSVWKKLPAAPLVNAVTVQQRTQFDKSQIKELDYGTVFTDVQSIVDFVCGYQEYLKDQGFNFEFYDKSLGEVRNWITSIKEFLFWTKSDWAIGSLLSLSPLANKIEITSDVGTLENLLDGFYDYQILQTNGTPIQPSLINVNRQYQKTTIETINNNDGIYFFQGYLVLKEHITVFSDRTVFNDVLFDKTTGYRQERIKSRGFRTSDWDGDYTSPGFLFDNVNIEAWQPFVDYRLGDIVSYRSYNWTSLEKQAGAAEFNETRWSRLDVTPEKQLISNFDFKINQIEDYYNVDSDGASEIQRNLARHALGYQTRQYLEELSEDQVTQFKLFQGFIREKGTTNAVVKVFDKLRKSNSAKIELKEEWAIQTGKLGGVDQLNYLEFEVAKGDFKLNPQPLIITSSAKERSENLNIFVDQSKFTYAPVPFTVDIFPTTKFDSISRSAGYVSNDQVDIILKSQEDLESIDINSVKENSHIWITFDKNSWTVLRFNQTSVFYIVDVTVDSDFISFKLNRPHNFKLGNYIGIKDINNIEGFRKIERIDNRLSFAIKNNFSISSLEFDFTSVEYNLCLLTESRFKRYSDINLSAFALSREGTKIWIDENLSNENRWQVVEKQSQYTSLEIDNYRIENAGGIGSSVLLAPNLKQTIFGVSRSGFVVTAVERNNVLIVSQLLTPAEEKYKNSLNNSFGSSLAISPDETWLAIGASNASGVPSNFAGDYDPFGNYGIGTIVLNQGRLWKAVKQQLGDGSTKAVNDFADSWEPADLIQGITSGDLGPTNQGAVFLYRRIGNQWLPSTVILSPRINFNEHFGTAIAISQDNGKYYMSVSAPGAVNELGRVYLFVFENDRWKIQDNSYTGLFESRNRYAKESIVWYENNLWKALEDIEKGSAFNFNQWVLADNISTFLPNRNSYNEVGNPDLNDSTLSDSTLLTGLIDNGNPLELVKPGDRFGHSISTNRDGSILIVSAPNSDSQFFKNYKGLWNFYSEYRTGDVVRYVDPLTLRSSYRELFDPRSDNDPNTDSTIVYTSIGEPPEGDPWKEVGDSTNQPSGKVFVYHRNVNGVYDLTQTIAAGNINDYNLTGIEKNISSGDQFGFALDIDSSGLTAVVSSPTADIDFKSQGSVYVLRRESLNSKEFKIVQRLQSFEDYPNEFFGTSVSISQRGESIVVGASNAKASFLISFDNNNTVFDGTRTKIVENRGNPGQVYVFDKKDQTYLLGEKLDAELQDFESFGSSIDNTDSLIAVASPGFRSTISTDALIVGRSYVIVEVGNTNWQQIGVSLFETPKVGLQFTATSLGSGSGKVISVINQGKVRAFKKDLNKKSWNIISEEQNLVDIDSIKSIAVYNDDENINLGNVNIVDNFRLKILGVAEQELSYKTFYDPAVYTNIGTNEESELDSDRAWFSDNVGKLWWDISTVKFYFSSQGDLSDKIGYWNKQVLGSSVDVYEWVESKFTPEQWSELADTENGLSIGISGQPYSFTSYSVKTLFNSLSGLPTDTKYYFWVKNKNTVPMHIPGRRISAADVSKLINSPEASNIPFISLISSNELLLWNTDSLLTSEKSLINIEYINRGYNQTPVHKEYQLLTENQSDSLPSLDIERKWIDSLVGYDTAGNRVPDLSLPEKQKYGLSFRPRQSMFSDRYQVLDSIIDNINTILKTRTFADIINYRNLNLVDQLPIPELNEYDISVEQLIDLETVGTVRVKPALLQANIVNGIIETVTIVDRGFGYKVPPSYRISGDGVGAEIDIKLDSQGRILSVDIISVGRNYTFANITVRSFSVLVQQDSSIDGYWSIYSWDNIQRVFTRSKIQSFDTTKYWKYIDWYNKGFSPISRIVEEINSFYQEPTVIANVGDVIKVSEFANGGWALLQKTEKGLGNIDGRYNLVGRQGGTIEIIKERFIPTTGAGIDSIATFDGNLYDIQPSAELRNILKAIKEDIFVDDLSIEWNKLFFTSLRYSFVQLPVVDWAFKTSFVNAVHNLGDFDQRTSYKNDNLESYQKYIEEVKPYRTTIREFTSKYTSVDNSQTSITDFDAPPSYSVIAGEILPASLEFSDVDQYPLKWFADNQGYQLVAINLIHGGSGYKTAPTVLIEGNGQGATAQAYVSSGRVSGVEITNPGIGYTHAPKISLVGGNGTTDDNARAAAVLGNSFVRTFDVSMKFDRVCKTGYLEEFVQTETIIATGFTATYELKFAPTTDKSKISIVKNNQLVLSNEFFVILYKTNVDRFSQLRGKITFVSVPAAGDTIEVTYDVNDEFLDSVNRIQKYYAPTAGMTGKELPQLMTGLDFGGVQVQGTTFDVTGGWDALPWFTDSWDSVESPNDFYYSYTAPIFVTGKTYNPGDLVKFNNIIYKLGGDSKSSPTDIPGSIGSKWTGFELESIELPFTPKAGEKISIYIKSALAQPVRIDSENFPASGSMPTFIGDDSTRVIELTNPDNSNISYISISTDDVLIFRPFDSDGSVIINDPNIIDTQVSGGTLTLMEGAYATASGITAEEIVINGGKFIEPDYVPAPEENIPGQVLDSVSIKVYHTRPQGAAALQNKVYAANGLTRFFNIGLNVFDINSVIVYIDKNKVNYNSNNSTITYSVNFNNNQIEFTIPPARGSVVEIVSIGIGGINLLDYQEFTADGDTDLFLTKALYNQTTSTVVTVNGNQVDVLFLDSVDFTDIVNRTIIKLGFKPSLGDVIKIVCLGAATDVDSTGLSFIRVNSQQFIFDGSTNRFELDGFVNLSRASANSSTLVEVGGKEVKGPDIIRRVYDGTNNQITLGIDPLLVSGTISLNDIVVYINNQLQPAITAYTFNNATKILTVNPEFLSNRDEIKVEVSVLSDFIITGNDLIFNSNFISTVSENAVVDITWFSEYPSFDIITDQYTGAQIIYQLKRQPLSSSYVWVYVNGNRLSQYNDFSVDVDRSRVSLNVKTDKTDDIKIVEFGNDIWSLPNAYEIYKDMLNIYHYKRYSANEVTLTQNLNYYDTELEVSDGTNLFEPIPQKNIPGVVQIGNERIAYLEKNGNKLSRLRRGSYGSAIAEVHKLGLPVADISSTETIPYADQQQRYDFVSDGTSLLIGELDFVPVKTIKNNWFKESIPTDYAACDQIEVFVGGRRLRKDPVSVYKESQGSFSPDGDIQIEAEFSVDGENPYFRLTIPAPAGARITVIRRVGKTWYDRGVSATTAGNGVTMHRNNNNVVSFILQKTTSMPE